MKKKTQTLEIDWGTLPQERFTHVGSRFEFDPRHIGGAILARHLLARDEGHVSEIELRGYIEEDDDDEEGLRFIRQMEGLGGRLLFKQIGDSNYDALFIWSHGLVQVEYNGNYLHVAATSHDEKFVADLQSKISKLFLPPVQRGHIFAIVRSGPHLQLSSIGDASIPLVASNYTPEVIEDYRFVIRDLQSENPSGRITVMEGEPGTGKTHLIRALLDEVPDAMFVLVSPEMVKSLSGPELLPLLLSNKSSYAVNGPIILVLEDADQCLVTRDGANINSIQSLLNLGDGILGSLLDLRIIATTNAKKLEMEAAILRPGRLSKRLEVGALDVETAKSVFRRLLPDIKFPKELIVYPGTKDFKMTLAEAYSLARKHGWEPKTREISKKKLSSDEDDSDLFD
jgi:hypothetical protein